MMTKGTSSPKDIKPISRIVSALNVLKMNIGMYPEGHASVDKSADHAYTLLSEYFKKSKDLSIGVTDKTLLVNATLTDKNNKNFQEYARILNNFHVIFLKLKSTVTRQELFHFSKILSSKPSDIQHMDNLEKILSGLSIKGIEVKTIDADYFHLTEEKNPLPTKSDDDFWRKFFAQMTLDKPPADSKNYEPGNAVPPGLAIDSALMEIIQKLNAGGQHWKKAVSGYEKMIEDFLHESRQGGQISARKYEMLGAISNLINHFHPELKKQLLNAAQRQISLQAETAIELENLNYLPDEMLSVIIHLANERQRQVPPALLMLMQRLSATGKSVQTHQKNTGQKMTALEMEGILKKEKHEEYIPQKYDQLLSNLSGSFSVDQSDEDVFPLSAHLKSLENDEINFSICRLVFGLLEKEKDEDNYIDYSDRLSQFVPDLLRTGQFSFLIGMMETLRFHAQHGASDKIRRRALSLSSIITHSDTIAQNINPLIMDGKETPEAVKFLVMSGEQNLPWLLDMYLDPAATSYDTLIEVIKAFGAKALEETAKRMKTQTPLKALRILSLLRSFGNESTVPLLKELFDFDDYAVKKDVLEILFSLRPSDAVALLHTSLRSSNHVEIQQGVSLTVLYQVGELMDEVMSLLKILYIREEDTFLNELIVRQLGASGSAWAVPYLERIAATRTSFSPQKLSRLKEILYESLNNFSQQDILSLLQKGSKSWNRKIRENCRKMMHQRES